MDRRREMLGAEDEEFATKRGCTGERNVKKTKEIKLNTGDGDVEKDSGDEMEVKTGG